MSYMLQSWSASTLSPACSAVLAASMPVEELSHKASQDQACMDGLASKDAHTMALQTLHKPQFAFCKLCGNVSFHQLLHEATAYCDAAPPARSSCSALSGSPARSRSRASVASVALEAFCRSKRTHNSAQKAMQVSAT